MNKKNNKRYGNVDFLKFLLAISITLFHARILFRISKPLFPFGNFAVDIFFLISGYYMTKGIYKKESTNFEFIKGKIKSFFPLHTIVFIMAFIAKIILSNYFAPNISIMSSLKNIFILAIRSIPEYLLLPISSGLGISLANINGVTWYLSSMLIGMLILYPIIKKYKDHFCSYFSIIIFLFVNGFLYINGGTLNQTNTSYIFVCMGAIRAVGMLSGGCFIYWFQNNNFNYNNKIKLTIIEIISWILVFGYMALPGFQRSNEFAIIYLGIIGVLITTSQKSYSSTLQHPFFNYLGKLSFAMFLNQSWIRKCFMKITFTNYRYAILSFLITVLIISIITLCIEKIYVKTKNKLINKKSIN